MATTVTAVTSITPIISALAVTAVRPGWRIALRRASRPAEPPTAAAGAPTSPAAPRTIRDGSRSLRPAGSLSRSAATGAIFVARRAGRKPATSVTSVPTSRATIAVRASNTVPDSGSERSSAPNTAFSPAAMPKPAAMPTIDAPSPRASASSSTEPSTWRRAAPTMRSIANSRVRWATVIESVLKIVNAPTRIATPPNTSRTVLMMPMKPFRPSSVKRSWAAAVWTSAPRPSRSPIAARTSAAGVPGLPATSTES